jgi:exo-beta-1,3-glucanase (GH17 family)
MSIDFYSHLYTTTPIRFVQALSRDLQHASSINSMPRRSTACLVDQQHASSINSMPRRSTDVCSEALYFNMYIKDGATKYTQQ